MPREAIELLPFVPPGQRVTASSGAPFNDIEFTVFDTDYMEGETAGYDVFCPVDPSSQSPGSDRIKYIKCVSNLDADARYGLPQGDRVILGLPGMAQPFFLRGPDAQDNDYAVLQNFDFRFGFIQLNGQASDYWLQYATPAQGAATEGWYLFYTGGADLDLIAFIFPCDDIASTIGGNPPDDPSRLCTPTKSLSLTDTNQFRFVNGLPIALPVIEGVSQFGSRGNDIVGGVTTDAEGFVYVFGSSDGNLDGDANPGNEVYVAKYSPEGTQLWLQEFFDTDGTYLFDAVADSEFIYVAGRTRGSIPGFTNAGQWDGLLAKLRLSNGEVVATDQWGNEGIDGWGNIVLDGKGHLYVSGQGSPVGGSGTDPDYGLAKYRTSDLENVWRVVEAPDDPDIVGSAEAWGGISFVAGKTPNDDRLVIAGWFATAARGAQAFIAVYENLNMQEPSRTAYRTVASNGFRADWILDNEVAADGTIIVVGFTSGSLDGPQQGLGDAFIASFSPDLLTATFRQLGTAQADFFRKMGQDDQGNLFVTGYTYGNYAHAGYAGANADTTLGSGDVWVHKFAPNLQSLAFRQFGTVAEDRALLHVRNGYVYVAGMTEYPLVGPSLGAFDGFLTVLDPVDLSVTSPIVTVTEIPLSVREKRFRVGPNPARGQVSLYSEVPKPFYYRFVAPDGRIVLAGFAQQSEVQLMLEWLEKGTYLVQVGHTGGFWETHRLVVGP
ncbi:MAG: SBBP repeat-containing protein [Bacteroidia bacterium]|nr:SBBP repeat-containing protein [Bacteroidia bacterium]